MTVGSNVKSNMIVKTFGIIQKFFKVIGVRSNLYVRGQKIVWVVPHPHVGAELQATNRVPRWRIGELPPDMEVSCEISRRCT